MQWPSLVIYKLPNQCRLGIATNSIVGLVIDGSPLCVV